MPPVKKDEKEKLSDREINCDYCPSERGLMYTAETADALYIISACRPCKVSKVPEKRLHAFLKWLWPKDGATLRQEMLDAKRKS